MREQIAKLVASERGLVAEYDEHTSGTVLGEVGFVLNSERTCDIVAASSDVRVLRLRADRLDQLLEEDPRLAAQVLYGLSKALCRRLAERSRS